MTFLRWHRSEAYRKPPTCGHTRISARGLARAFARADIRARSKCTSGQTTNRDTDLGRDVRQIPWDVFASARTEGKSG